MMMVDYDANDPSPDNPSSFLNAQGASRGPLWNKLTLNCPISNLHKLTKEKFIRTGNRAISDLLTYDTGTLNIIALGDIQNKYVGDLFVEYHIELLTPQINTTLVTGSYLKETIPLTITQSIVNGATDVFANSFAIGTDTNVLENRSPRTIGFKNLNPEKEYYATIEANGTVSPSIDADFEVPTNDVGTLFNDNRVNPLDPTYLVADYFQNNYSSFYNNVKIFASIPVVDTIRKIGLEKILLDTPYTGTSTSFTTNLLLKLYEKSVFSPN